MESSPRELTITGTLQREAWLQRVMPPPEQERRGLIMSRGTRTPTYVATAVSTA